VNDGRTSKGPNVVLVTASASPAARRGALVIVVALSVAFCALTPFTRVLMSRVGAFIPIFDATFALINFITASLLLVVFRRSRMRAVLCLASGYLFTSLIVVAHLLSFPDMFSNGLLGAEPQTSAWLETFRHAGLPLLVICYALLRRYEGVGARSRSGALADIIWAAAGAVAGAWLLTFFAGTSGQLFPRTMLGLGSGTMMMVANVAVWLLSLAALAVLGSRPPYSILDLWLLVVVFAWMIDGVLSAVLSAERFDIGFYTGRLFGLLAASLLPVILLFEASRLYSRLDEAIALAEDRSAELARSREELAQAQRLEAIGQLTGGVAHDFNNLLAVIIGNLELLQRARGDAEKIERLAQGAMKAAQRGERLVRQLLTYARKQITRPQTVNPNQLIADIENLIRRAIGEQIEVIMRLSPLLAPAQIDPTEFETAILNLVINSRDAMTGGGRITIETQNVTIDRQFAGSNPEVKPGPYVMITVSDCGTGMTPAVQARAFDPFFTTKEVGKGSGLGLSQVYGFAKTTGGHVTIESELGIGTTVKLYLPKSSDRPMVAETGDEATSFLTSGYTATALSREHGLPDNLNVVEKPYQREELAKKLRLVIGG
jgi:signal transduction histidine kinase